MYRNRQGRRLPIQGFRLMKKRRLIWQIYPSYLIIVVVSVIAVTWYSSTAFRKFYYTRTEQELSSAACLVAEQLKDRSSQLDSPKTDKLFDSLGNASGYRLSVLLPSGKVVGDSQEDPLRMDDHRYRPEIQQAINGRQGTEKRYSNTLKMEMLYVAIPLMVDNQNAGIIRAALPLAQIEQALNLIWLRLTIAVIVLAGIAAIATMLVARQVSRPLAAIRAGAESFGRGNLGNKLAPSDVVEIDVLADTMNRMADQLNTKIATISLQRDEQNALLSCMRDAVIAVDNEKCVMKINKAAETLFQINTTVCTGKNIAEVVRNVDLLNIIDLTFKSTIPVKGTVIMGDSDRYIEALGTVLRGDGNNEIGALIVLHDITHLHKVETMRRDFVANVSHELRTPVTSIKGFIDTLIDTPVDDNAARNHFMEIIRKQANRLQAIIEDLLALSNLEHEVENNEIELNSGPINNVLRNAVESCMVFAKKKNITVHVNCPQDLNAMINIQLLEQAVINLIGNAVKYSDPGTQVTVTGEAAEKEIAIHVQDEGPGISQKHLSRLFERFYRVDKARSRQLGGTGLGLAVVKHIALAHNGRTEVQSELGEGSTFSIFLPKSTV